MAGMSVDFAKLADELRARAVRGRYMLGITGPPGCGKTTFAHQLAHSADATVVQMDGFHLTNAQLREARLTDVKGSPQTFDGQRFVELLKEIRGDHKPVRAPMYSRVLHEPIPHLVPIETSDRLVIIEGNYLLLDDEPWAQVGPLLDAVWYLDVPIDVCMLRVRDRHVRGGCSEAEADAKIERNDRPNAQRVERVKAKADRVITV